MKRILYAAWPFGLALLVVGVGWGVMAPRVMPVAYQALIGVGLVLSAAGLWGGRAFLFDRVGGKRVRFGAGFLLSALVGLLIVLLINFISARYHQRWDLTRTRSFSLHPATLRVIEKIDGDVDVVIVGTPEYHGGISGVLKNAIDLMGSHELRSTQMPLGELTRTLPSAPSRGLLAQVCLSEQ